MKEFLLIFLTSTGHVNGHVDRFEVTRHKTELECREVAQKKIKEQNYGEPRFQCVPVAPLPKEN